MREMATENPQLMNSQDTGVGRTLDRLQRATSLRAKPIDELVAENGTVTSFYRRRGVSLTVIHAREEAPKVSKPLLRKTDFRIDGDTYAVNVSSPADGKTERRRRVVDVHGRVDQALVNAQATLNAASVNRGVAQNGAELTVVSDANDLEVQSSRAKIGRDVLGTARVTSESFVRIHRNAKDLYVDTSGVDVDGDVTGKTKVVRGQILVKGDANIFDSYRSTVRVIGTVQEAECYAGSLTAYEIVTKNPGRAYMNETRKE
jgi:hypothetical protein